MRCRNNTHLRRRVVARRRARGSKGIPLHSSEARVRRVPRGVILTPGRHVQVTIGGVEDYAVVADLLHALVVNTSVCLGNRIVSLDIRDVTLQSLARGHVEAVDTTLPVVFKL